MLSSCTGCLPENTKVREGVTGGYIHHIVLDCQRCDYNVREHTAACTGTRARVANDVQTLLLVDLAGSKRAVRLERVRDVHVLARLETERGAIYLTDTRADRTAIDHDCRTVVANGSNDATRHVLVATGRQTQWGCGRGCTETYPGMAMLPS